MNAEAAHLNIVPIGPTHNAYPFDLRKWEGFNITSAYQTQATNTTAICEVDVSAIRLKFPASRFVLDTAVVLLKARIALLARFLGFAVVIEALNGRPCTISTGLTCLR